MAGHSKHPDFKEVEAGRPPWRHGDITYTKTVDPDWRWGQGGNDAGESLKKNHVEIDPYEEGRPASKNYKLLISSIVPRPIGFVSTRSADGSSTNLAPFSYTQVVSHDPPVFVIGYSGGFDNPKDSLRNLKETGECTINIISEHFIEAANSTAINAPYGTSEWSVSGLHPAPSKHVQPSRVKEAIFTAECKVMELKELESRVTKGKKTGVIAILEGFHFWVREDAIDDERSVVDINVLRPMSRLGGIMYGRTTEVMELPRPDFEASKDGHLDELLQQKVQGQ